MKRQLAFILARSLLPIEWIEPSETTEEEQQQQQEDLLEDLLECLGNARLSQYLKEFGKELTPYGFLSR